MKIRKIWMVILTASLFLILFPLPQVEAKGGTVYDQFDKNAQHDNEPAEKSLAQSNISIVPYLFKFIFSFILIIVLLYFVLKYLSKKTKLHQAGGPFHALGGHSLGNNRSLQMIMIGETLYVVGVGENVNVIRTIPPGEEQTKLLEAIAEKENQIDQVSKWSLQIKKTAQVKWEELLQNQLKEFKPNREKNKEQTHKGDEE